MYKARIVFTDGPSKKYEYKTCNIRDGVITLSVDEHKYIVIGIANLKYIENE